MKSEYDFSQASVGKFYRKGARVRLPDGGSDQRPDTDRRTPQFDKLIALLKELFQLDRPDLDFGFYRIMHAKSAEITKFLEQDLLPQVRDALSQYQSADTAVLEGELADALRSAEALGVNPDDSTTVKGLRARLDHTVDVQTLEAEVYDHLYGFFRRYHSDGDFISRRMYKPGVYAIPYEGEEVKLHWANADQYYIKTAEYLRDYAFRLQPSNCTEPMRVHFRMADAAEGEYGNAQATGSRKRVFLLRETDFIAAEDGEHGKDLIVCFEYRPATLADWPATEREGKKKPPDQKDLLRIAEHRLLDARYSWLARWQKELGAVHVTANGERSGDTRLRVHLNRYTARNRFDYFIHKDLSSFLRRELDFYIKNEVMHLDDVEQETLSGVQQHISKIKAMRRIATTIIDFLAQLEDFQKKLWMKKKFVVETSYCIRLACIPKAFHAKILANDAQRREWLGLLGLTTENVSSDPLSLSLGSSAGTEAYPSLVVDTRHFDEAVAARLLEALSSQRSLDDQCDGVVIQGDNLAALKLLRPRYEDTIGCIYIDPPYNTGNDGFVYKDDYRHSSWMTMMHDRLAHGRLFIKQDGAIICSIDESEQPNLRKLLDTTWGKINYVADMVWAAGRKNDSRLVSVSHEYMTVYASSRQHLAERKLQWRQKKKGLDDIYAQYNRLKKKHGTDYASLTTQMKKWFRDLPDSHPAKKHRHYSCVDQRGPYFPDNISWPGGGGPMYEVLHPRTGKPVRVPAPGWRLTEDKMQQYLDDDLIHFGDDENAVPCIKSYLKDRQHQVPYSVFYQDGRAATRRLRDVLGMSEFGYPKDENVIADVVGMVIRNDDMVLDFFAGSGTTAHAVVNLNREDGGQRRFILVEAGSHFDSVLLPRVKKITVSPEWKGGKPKRGPTLEEMERSPRIVKVLRLESYEDTLNNLVDPRRTDDQQVALGFAEHEHGRAGRIQEEYLLHYMLDVETRGSSSLVDVGEFVDPTQYRLNVKRPGSDEGRDVKVDLIETFNWLIGLAVHRMTAPRAYSTDTERDAEGRMQLVGGLSEQDGGRWWFRTVTGTMPDGRRVFVIWRKRPGGESPDGIERDNLVLDEWFKLERSLRGDDAYDLVYVNGSNNLENLKSPSDTWTVRLIEDDFHRLMWEQ